MRKKNRITYLVEYGDSENCLDCLITTDKPKAIARYNSMKGYKINRFFEQRLIDKPRS